MRLKSILVAALAAVTFASCSKSSTPGSDPTDGESDLLIQFSQAEGKAPVAPVTGGKVSFSEGALFITDASGDVLNYIVISNGAAGAVRASQLEAGYVIRGVKNTAREAYIVGNFDFTATGVPASFANISEVQDLTTDLSKQQDALGGVENASLYGAGTLQASNRTVTVNGETITIDREVKITVGPLIARLEVDKITATSYLSDPTLGIDDGYVLEGIYINNFYYKVDVTGVAAEPLYNFRQEWQKYMRDDHPTAAGDYKASWYPFVFDDGGINQGGTATETLGTATNHIIAAADVTTPNYTWAYNVFAEASATPHIVFHLSNIKQSGTARPNATIAAAGSPGDGDGVAYLTVTTYLNSGSIVPVTGGKVYKIANIPFSMEELTDTPEPGDNDSYEVFVEIELMEWEVVPVEAGLDK